MHRLANMVDFPPCRWYRYGQVISQLSGSQLHGCKQSVEAHEQHAAGGLALSIGGGGGQ